MATNGKSGTFIEESKEYQPITPEWCPILVNNGITLLPSSDDTGFYRFKYKPTGQWIHFENGPWVLRDYPSEIYDVYEYVNEIMEDLECKFEDIEIINEPIKNN